MSRFPFTDRDFRPASSQRMRDGASRNWHSELISYPSMYRERFNRSPRWRFEEEEEARWNYGSSHGTYRNSERSRDRSPSRYRSPSRNSYSGSLGSLSDYDRRDASRNRWSLLEEEEWVGNIHASWPIRDRDTSSDYSVLFSSSLGWEEDPPRSQEQNFEMEESARNAFTESWARDAPPSRGWYPPLINPPYACSEISATSYSQQRCDADDGDYLFNNAYRSSQTTGDYHPSESISSLLSNKNERNIPARNPHYYYGAEDIHTIHSSQTVRDDSTLSSSYSQTLSCVSVTDKRDADSLQGMFNNQTTTRGDDNASGSSYPMLSSDHERRMQWSETEVQTVIASQRFSDSTYPQPNCSKSFGYYWESDRDATNTTKKLNLKIQRQYSKKIMEQLSQNQKRKFVRRIRDMQRKMVSEELAAIERNVMARNPNQELSQKSTVVDPSQILSAEERTVNLSPERQFQGYKEMLRQLPKGQRKNFYKRIRSMKQKIEFEELAAIERNILSDKGLRYEHLINSDNVDVMMRNPNQELSQKSTVVDDKITKEAIIKSSDPSKILSAEERTVDPSPESQHQCSEEGQQLLSKTQRRILRRKRLRDKRLKILAQELTATEESETSDKGPKYEHPSNSDNADVTVRDSNQTLPEKSAVVGNIKVAIIKSSYPAEILNADEREEILSEILKRVDSTPPGGVLPRIICNRLFHGTLIIEGEDSQTAEWVQNVFDGNAEVIKKCSLRVVNAKVLPKPYRVSLYTKDTKTTDDEKFLQRLSQLNPKLGAEDWRVERKYVLPNVTRWFFEVGSNSVKAIKEAKYVAFTGIDKANFKILDPALGYVGPDRDPLPELSVHTA